MNRVLVLSLALFLAPAAVFAQPPPGQKSAPPSGQKASPLSRCATAPVHKLTPRKLESRTAGRAGPCRQLRFQSPLRVQQLTQPSPLHLLGSSLQGLPPPLPPALLNRPVERPSALRQLQFQLDLLHVGSR